MKLMNIENAKEVIQELSEKPFICTERSIETERYIITKIESKKPKTNADRIRNMSDKELAEFLGKTVYYCRGRQESKYCDECPLLECGACNEIVIKRWLQAEVKEGDSNAGTEQK